MSDESHGHDVIIIKRHGEHEHEHHGGVWKIAFADFMTAMMAFFLVMWLLSANDKTKVAIAKYFNPVELVDATPQPPGLNDPKKTDPSVSPPSTKPASTSSQPGQTEDKTEAGGDSPKSAMQEANATSLHDEAELTHDPYAVLAEIANKANRAAPEKTPEAKIADAQRGIGSQGRVAGEAFRDPFDISHAGAEDLAPGPFSPNATVSSADPADKPQASPQAAASQAATPSDAASQAAASQAAPAGSTPAGTAHSPTPATAAGASAAASNVADDKPIPAAALRAKIAALGKAQDGSPATSPKLEVKQTSEGLLISLTDSADFSMFPISSARPAPKTVLLIEKIGALLKAQKGNVVVRGFTDSRPFRSELYDNWRLSATRAQMAHYLLVAGGVSDARFDRIEGYADRRPKNAANPEAAENRRIEILLRDGTP